MKTAIEYITPAIALKYLKHNKINRKLDHRHVDFLSRQMTDGVWIDNGETIKITTDGTLIDSQHRLRAIIKANKPQKIVVVRDLPPEAFKTIDVDRKPRNLTTVLELEGYKNCVGLSSGLRVVGYFLPSGNYSESVQRISIADAEQIIADFPELIEWASLTRKFNRPPIANSFLIGCGVMFGRSKWVRTSPFDFIHMIATGENLSHGSPALTLRNRAIRIRSAGGVPNRKETILMMIAAWNKEQKGEKMRSIHSHAKVQRICNLHSDFSDPSRAEHPK